MAFIYSLADTWNDGATTFKGISLNVTDTASAAGSLLMDLQVGGVSRFSVTKGGVSTVGRLDLNSSTYSIYQSGSHIVLGRFDSALFAIDSGFGPNDGCAKLAAAGAFAWSAVAGATNNADLFLRRDAANTLAQRNGVNAQAFNLYNTYTDASNYERGALQWSGNVLHLLAQRAGTGTDRDIQIGGRDPGNGANFQVRGIARTAIFRHNSTNYFTVDMNTGHLHLVFDRTVAGLTATPAVGMIARVTDATAPTIGSTVTGGGAAAALCWYNGTNWTVIGA